LALSAVPSSPGESIVVAEARAFVGEDVFDAKETVRRIRSPSSTKRSPADFDDTISWRRRASSTTTTRSTRLLQGEDEDEEAAEDDDGGGGEDEGKDEEAEAEVEAEVDVRETAAMTATATSTTHFNVWGQPLQPCSLSGMAKTGRRQSSSSGGGGMGEGGNDGGGAGFNAASFYGRSNGVGSSSSSQSSLPGGCIVVAGDAKYSDESETICIDMTSLFFTDYCKVVGASAAAAAETSSDASSSSNDGNSEDASNNDMDSNGGGGIGQEGEEADDYDPWWWCSQQGEDLPCQDDDEEDSNVSYNVSDSALSSSAGSFTSAPSVAPTRSSADSDDDVDTCPMENWCVTPESFSLYVKKAGCLAIGRIECESVNMDAIKALEAAADATSATGDRQYSDAIDCIVDRCGLFLVFAPSQTTIMFGSRWLDMLGFVAAMVGVVLGALSFMQLTYREPDFVEPLTTDKENECELQQNKPHELQ